MSARVAFSTTAAKLAAHIQLSPEVLATRSDVTPRDLAPCPQASDAPLGRTLHPIVGSMTRERSSR